jgi:Fe-S-cluster containining protein
MRTVRIAIVGPSPCDQCVAACCKQWGPDYAVLLRGDEVRKFAPFSVDVPVGSGGRVIVEKVLPYVDGRCQFLGPDDRCTIYEDRPQSCREFECTPRFKPPAHDPFLQGNPRVLKLLNTLAVDH